jgi:hypothetical protein
VVTLFSEGLAANLTPLHRALYKCLRREGWLLVGSPTRERVEFLNGTGEYAAGAYVSVDYKSATDNIKLDYVRRAVKVLKEKAGVPLTDDQCRALDVVANLRVGDPESGWRSSVVCQTGQPMGAVMSFPLLCLINKTTVDMAITDMLRRREVSVKEWRSHRCLINGDDLLYRDFKTAPGKLLSGIRFHGSKIGFIVNDEKTMVDAEYGEINSTVFRNGVEERKVNVSSLFMKRDVADVLGYAAQSVVSRRGFRTVVRRNVGLLYGQKEKVQGPLPGSYFSVLQGDSRIRSAICHDPEVSRVPDTNPLPITRKPAGYDLTRVREVAVINREVERLRSLKRKVPKGLRQRTKEGKLQSVQQALRRKKPRRGESILSVLAHAWEETRWDAVVKEDTPEVNLKCMVGDGSRCEVILDHIRTWKQSRERNASAKPPESDPLRGGAGYVDLLTGRGSFREPWFKR